jgi:hypothetical protein
MVPDLLPQAFGHEVIGATRLFDEKELPPAAAIGCFNHPLRGCKNSASISVADNLLIIQRLLSRCNTLYPLIA